MKFTATILFLAAIKLCSLSQVNTNLPYFPLNIGNVWVYECNATGMACNCTKRYSYRVTSAVELNSKTYYLFQRSVAVIGCSYGFCDGVSIYDTLRIDSVTANLYKYSFNGCLNSPSEVLLDSLDSELNDTVRNYCGISQYKYICIDTASEYIFGSYRHSKRFAESQFETGYGRKFTYGIGITESGYGSVACGQTSVLKGCVLNGVVYGDTSMLTGITQISNEVPLEFSLLQNYPNPFNPSTHFGFQIAEFGLVRLTVFDVLGKEVQVLVNQDLQPGTYEVDFDGSNLPSGVYYYKLDASASLSITYNETRKMVLIK